MSVTSGVTVVPATLAALAAMVPVALWPTARSRAGDERAATPAPAADASLQRAQPDADAAARRGRRRSGAPRRLHAASPRIPGLRRGARQELHGPAFPPARSRCDQARRRHAVRRPPGVERRAPPWALAGRGLARAAEREARLAAPRRSRPQPESCALLAARRPLSTDARAAPRRTPHRPLLGSRRTARRDDPQRPLRDHRQAFGRQLQPVLRLLRPRPVWPRAPHAGWLARRRPPRPPRHQRAREHRPAELGGLPASRGPRPASPYAARPAGHAGLHPRMTPG